MRMPAVPPDYRAELRRILTQGPDKLMAILENAKPPGYPPWDKVKYLTPPDGVSHGEWWVGIRLSRHNAAREIPALQQKDGSPFSYSLPDELLAGLDRISQRASGEITASELAPNPSTRDRYLVSSLIEEAITSSQLEGAHTTRRVAKEMLRSGRPPQDRSERMIANNYAAMQFVHEHRHEPITPALVFALHRVVTAGALDNPEAAGQIQRPGDSRVGVWTMDDVQVHSPPPADELPARLDSLCHFANDHTGWMHPVLRAIIVHFMMGYDHYFEDGNGRTARALFYWIALQRGFWLLEFVTISKILHGAPAQYGRSFLLTEDDEGDLTHFALHHVAVINRAIDELHKYLARKNDELARARQILGDKSLNYRETAIVQGVLRNPDLELTAQSHARSHDVSLQTARSDLRRLASAGYLTTSRRGRQEVWRAAGNLSRLISDAEV